MGGTCRQAGADCIISRTYALADEGTYGGSDVADVPDLTTFPGRYMAALAPSYATGSTVVHLEVLRSSTCEAIIPSEAPAASTRPSGSTNICGYSGSVNRA